VDPLPAGRSNFRRHARCASHSSGLSSLDDILIPRPSFSIALCSAPSCFRGRLSFSRATSNASISRRAPASTSRNRPSRASRDFSSGDGGAPCHGFFQVPAAALARLTADRRLHMDPPPGWRIRRAGLFVTIVQRLFSKLVPRWMDQAMTGQRIQSVMARPKPR
jgi:hypothetical protein